MTGARETPVHGSGICSRCQTYTEDGIVRVIHSASGPGGRVVYCAGYAACKKRRQRRD